MNHIAVGGSTGKMGKLLVERVESDQKAKLVAALSRQQFPKSLKDITDPIDIFIDFTSPSATLTQLPICLERNIAMVIGTTGFTDSEFKSIQKAAEHIPIVYSPNMSLGVNTTFGLLKTAGEALTGMAEVAISEIHHKNKKDSPSGTALKMAEILAEAKPTISSSRVGEVPGEHRIVFALEGETLEITHVAQNRMPFAKGALKAAHWLKGRKPGLYTMMDVLGI